MTLGCQPPTELLDRGADAARHARHAELRAASAHAPTREEIEAWPPDYEHISRLLGQPLERELRKLERWRPWWFDPELPLDEVLGPQWDGDTRPDNGEHVEHFARIVGDYADALRGGAVFPPLLVSYVDPDADRACFGRLRYFFMRRGQSTAGCPYPHYVCWNGRHRGSAAWLVGRRTHPAYVLAPLAEISFPWTDDAGAAEAAVIATARERGRRGWTPGAEPAMW